MGLHFSKEEFSNRKEKTLNSMKNEGLDALIMFRQESMYWLTGYDTFGYVFFQALVLDQKGNIILLTRAPDLRQAQNTSNISDIRIWVDKDGANPADDLKIILDELNLKGKKIGIEYEAYGMTGRNALKLNKSLSANKLIGVQEINRYLNGLISLDECKEHINIKTRQYAKRQNTWARGHMKNWNKLYSKNFSNLLKKSLKVVS